MSAFINAARAATSRAVAIDDGSVFIEEVSFGAGGLPALMASLARRQLQVRPPREPHEPRPATRVPG